MAAVDKRYLQEVYAGGRADKVQGPLANSTATRITNYGVTFITATTAEDYKFAAAPKKGVYKTIVATVGSTKDLRLLQATTGVTYYGTTHSTVTFSSGVGAKALSLIGVSTSQWAILSKSTGVTTSA